MCEMDGDGLSRETDGDGLSCVRRTVIDCHV